MPKITKKTNMPDLGLESTNMDFKKQAKTIADCDEEVGKDLPENGGGANNVVADWMKQFQFDADLPNGIASVFDQVKSAPAGKKKACISESDVVMNSWKKKFGVVMKKQTEKRKRGQESLMQGMQTVLSRMEADATMLNNNGLRMRDWCTSLMKQSQQTVQCNQQKLDMLRRIMDAYTADCEKADAAQEQETRGLEQELAASVQEMQERLQKECRRKNAESLRKAMSMMMDQ